MSPDKLVAAVRTRLDEDEAAARRAVPGPWDLQGHPRETVVCSEPTGVSVALGWARDLEHIARHDPASVLRRVAADREIVDMYEPMRLGVEAVTGTIFAGAAKSRLRVYEAVLRALARGLGIDAAGDTG